MFYELGLYIVSWLKFDGKNRKSIFKREQLLAGAVLGEVFFFFFFTYIIALKIGIISRVESYFMKVLTKGVDPNYLTVL